LGGGLNHRFNLSDEILIKDNHIAIEGDIRKLVKKAIKNRKGKKITVEVDNLNQLKKVMGLKFDRILFDNMNLNNLRRGIKLSYNFYETEASGGITLKNVRKFASTGVKRISVGQITHSVPAINFKLEI
jgi:nicotinate-nucleotide pyrophosphorylase (carboxylating)